ncbi:MAG TPA: UDP-N-acetylmuramate dehydrogenase [Actinomycetota bacterium]|jgi:UDP-N-acetylmuramate dehydrogenase|nr:UDP-N-acetylmuramate dehydrogenase [Actinomycetota bacterium]
MAADGPARSDGPAPSKDGNAGAAERILREVAGDRVRRAFPLARLTSFRLGGPAALYLEAGSQEDLSAVGRALRETGLPFLVIGKGSNLLVSDGGFPGLVLRLGRAFRWAARDGDRITAGGAMPLPALAGVALAHSLAGLEFGVAIPASLGGSVRMNAGAHGRSLDEVLESAEVFLAEEDRLSVVLVEEAGFRYRDSTLPERSVVIGATVRLHPGDPSEIRALMDEARQWRRATQPLAEPNCGSVFKNPPGDHAARLVEAAGAKGLAVGGAVVSEKHANFIVAREGATARDVHLLIALVRDRVHERFGVRLEPEVHLVGEFDEP